MLVGAAIRRSPQADAVKVERNELDMHILPENLQSELHGDTLQQQCRTRGALGV